MQHRDEHWGYNVQQQWIKSILITLVSLRKVRQMNFGNGVDSISLT